MPVLHPEFWRLLSPEWVLVAFGIVFLILSAVKGGRSLRVGTGALALAGFLVALVLTLQTLWAIPPGAHVSALSGLDGGVGLWVDAYSQSFKVVFLLGAILATLLSFKHLDVMAAWTGEYFTFLTFSVFGMMVMASGADLLTLWVGLETMALAVYVLAAYLRRDEKSVEGATKYFLLGAFSSGLYLYGTSLIYGVTGTVHLSAVKAFLASRIQAGGLESLGFPLAAGVVILAAALLFKAALVPFHWWTPDAYEGAATPITGFMSVAPKAAAFAMAIRIFAAGLLPLSATWTGVLGVVAVLTMIWGNVAAMVQDNVKRMLAYSSIAHAGYVLIGLVASGRTATDQGIEAALLYLLVYAFMNLGAFGLILYLQREGSAGDRMEDFDGLIHRSPWAAVLMIFFLLSLGGIPPMAGFVAKLMIFYSAVSASLYLLAVVLAVTSVVSLYYYFRLVYRMFLRDPQALPAPRAGWTLAAGLWICGAATLAFGLYGQPLITWAARISLLGR
ncbi:MAG: NADH-quinone oxidoreductase subunit N [Acidobacteriota bacterium]